MWLWTSRATVWREVLGLWIADDEGAKFWLSVMTELKNRGVQDVLNAVMPSHGLQANHCRVIDGLKGFPEAITAAFPEATVQTCIVHLVRHSLNFCAWKNRKVVAPDLRRIYSAATADQAAAELDAFEEKWAGKSASIAPTWRRAWQEVGTAPVSPETYRFISRDHIEHVALCTVVLFGLGRQDVPDGAKQPPFVELRRFLENAGIDPSESGHFEILHVAPRPLAIDPFGFVEAVYRLGEGVVVAVTNASDRWFDASLGQPVGVSNRQILPAAVRMVNQSALLHRPSIMQGLLQSIHCPAGNCEAICREGRTKSVLADRETRQPTIRSANVSITKAT